MTSIDSVDRDSAHLDPGKRPKSQLTAKKSGRPPVMSRESIGRAALAELEGLSSTKVARRLGVGQSSLYRHIIDRTDLVRLAVDFGLTHQSWPAPGSADTWRDYLLDFAHAFWSFLERNPGAAQEIKVLRPSPQKLIETVTEIARELVRFGFTPADANTAVDLVGHITLDCMISEEVSRIQVSRDKTLQEEQREAWARQDDPDLAQDSLRSLDGGTYQILKERIAVVLDGFELRLSQPSYYQPSYDRP